MKTVSLLIILLYLLLPLACVAHPCDSCLGSPDVVDTSGGAGSNSHNQDSDNCDSTFCCAVYVNLNTEITVVYAPLVSLIVTDDRYQQLPNIVSPIFVPPQSLV